MTEMKNGLGLTTQETIELAQGIQPAPRSPTSAAVKTGIAVANYLYGFPLETPSKKLYFIEDAMRRRIPRKLNETGGYRANWKVITGINTGHVLAGVAEGAVNSAAITLASAEKYVPYRTLNMYNTYTDEARFFGRKFEDIPQLGMLVTLQNLMIQEDRELIASSDVTIGSPTTVTATDVTATTSTFGTNTYYFVVSALTLQAYLNQTDATAGHITGVDAPGESIGTTCNTGSGLSVTATHNVTLAWTDVPGAFAYNIYCNASAFATAVYIGTATCNSITLTSPITYGGHTAGTGVHNTADQTSNQYGYEGIIQQLTALTGTAGSTGSYGTKTCYYLDNAGVAPTADGAGGCVEVEKALQSIWNNYRISPTMMLINAQEGRSIKKLAIGSSSTNAVRITVTPDGKNEFGAGSAVNSYWNPYTAQWIELVTSVHTAPGKLMMLGETVPYPNSETPNNFEVDLQQEYYGEIFARVARQTPVGVTCIGQLKVYLPGACGIIANLIAA